MSGENQTVFVGTVGQAIWRSEDGGDTFRQACRGMFIEAEVRGLAVHPQDTKTLYAATDAGLFRTRDGGDNWEWMNTPFDPGRGWQGGILCWSVLVHPADPSLIFVGTCPPALYRSRDGGAKWEKCAADMDPECPPIVYSRVTCLLADPTDANTVWAGVEVDGIWRSGDRGETWEKLGEGLSSQDIHSLAVVPGPNKTLLAATNNDLNRSKDEGQTWQPLGVENYFPHRYCRRLAQKADDPNTIFVGNGNGPPGNTGSLQISRDGGATFVPAELPVPAQSTIWTFAINPAAPNLIFAATILGQLYRSRDGGATWQICPHAFGEIRSLACV